MREVVTLGECMAVFYPEEAIPLDQASTLAIDIAGAEANLAIGLSRLGHCVQFISRVGNDPFGLRIRATLAAERVDTACVLTDSTAPTGVFFREWLPDGLRRVRRQSDGARGPATRSIHWCTPCPFHGDYPGIESELRCHRCKGD